MNIERTDITRGYVPVRKLDANIMASHKVLAEMNFSNTEIDKLETGLKARTTVLKSRKDVVKNIQQTLIGGEHPIFPKPVVCDVCGGTTGIGIVQLTSEERSKKIPSDWILLRFDKEKDRVYAVISPGVAIDYSKGKVYIVCGTCQVKLGLKSTESGFLIHEIRNGFGYVDLDKIENIMGENRF